MANRYPRLESSLRKMNEGITLWVITVFAVFMPMSVFSVVKQEIRKTRIEIPCYVCGRREAIRKVGPYNIPVFTGTGKDRRADYIWLCSECKAPKLLSVSQDGIVIDGAYSGKNPLFLSILLILGVLAVNCVFVGAAVALWRRKMS